MRTAIITDTNSGLSETEAKKYDIKLIAMPFSIGGEDYLEGVNLSIEEFLKMQAADMDISTSQPSPLDIMQLWDELLQSYDNILHIPMSSALSNSCETAMALSKDEPYEGRVYVVDSLRISATQVHACIEARNMLESGMEAAKVAEVLYEHRYDYSIYLTVDTLKYLKKGGRITPAAALIGTLLNIKPVLTIQGGKLDSFAKVRTIKQAKATMLSAIKADLEKRFEDSDGSKTRIAVVHANNDEVAKELREEILKELPGVGDISIANLSLSIVTHTGPGVIAIAASKKLS